MAKKQHDDVFRRYLTETKQPIYEELSDKELSKLVENHRQGDTNAREQLVNSMQGYVTHLASKYKEGELTMMDIIQAGNIGLLDAIEKYDKEKNVKFKSYATLRINGAILDEFRFERRKGFMHIGRNITPHIISPSHHEKVNPYGDTESDSILGTIPADDGRGPLEKLFEKEFPITVREEIGRKFNRDARARNILGLVLEERTLKEIGELMGCTEPNISQLYKKYRKTLKVDERLKEELEYLNSVN